MRKKTLFAFSLCAVLALLSLSGCGNEKDDADKTPSVTQGILPDGNGNTEDGAGGNDASQNDGTSDDGENSGNDGTADGTDKEGNVAPAIEITHTRDLSNPNASKKAQLVYDYLCSVTGQGIISGVEESPNAADANTEVQYVKRVAGKYPALKGLDFINNDFDGVVKRAKFWANDMKGLVTIGWHWGAPPNGVGYDSSKGSVDMDELLTEGSDLYNAMLAQMDVAAESLKELQEEDIVVLWRPFHEFDGQWFWWGKGGSEKFIELWKLMYDRYTNYHGLNNLIWVLGYSGEVKKDWYPGDEYVDICGADSYKSGTRSALYKVVSGYGAEGMPVPLHECAIIPDPDKLQEEGVNWTWFMTWTIKYLQENTKDEIKAIFNHDYVITLDELPDFEGLMGE